jgi:hypothetical protein
MARWMIAATMIAFASAPLCAAAQDRAAPPLFSPSPNAECQRQTGGHPMRPDPAKAAGGSSSINMMAPIRAEIRLISIVGR